MNAELAPDPASVNAFAALMNPMASFEAHERLSLSVLHCTVYRPLDKLLAPSADSDFIGASDFDKMIDELAC